MINVRIYDKEDRQIDSIRFTTMYCNNKYSVLSCLDKAITYANARYGQGHIYKYAIVDYADGNDYRFKYD